MDAAKKVVDQIKRNGEFDKCRREVLAKVMESENMKRSIEQCHRLVNDVLRRAPPDANIMSVRDVVKDELRKRNLINPLLGRAERAFREYENSSKLHDLIDELARSELGLPPPDTNIELVDMDVSSGASSSTTTSRSGSASGTHSEKDESISKLENGHGRVKREVSPTPPPPPPPASSSASPPPPPPPSKRPHTPTEPEHGGRSTKRKASSLGGTITAKLAAEKTEIADPSPLSSAHSSPRCAFVSTSPSMISDDSLPPFPTTSDSPQPTLEQINETKPVSQLPPLPLHGHDCKIEAISESEESEHEQQAAVPVPTKKETINEDFIDRNPNSP